MTSNNDSQGGALHRPDAPQFVLPGSLTIFEVGALKSLLAEWLAAMAAAEETPVRVDASAVGEADAAGVQVLVAFSRSLAARGRSLQLVNASSLLAGACQTLGVSALLLANETTGAVA